MKTLTLFLLLAVACWAEETQRTVAERAAYFDGWMAAFTDQVAVDSFHWQCDSIPDDRDDGARAKIWGECVMRAKESEERSNKLTQQQRADYPLEPFWKRGVGEPRRLMKGPRKEQINDADLRELIKAIDALTLPDPAAFQLVAYGPVAQAEQAVVREKRLEAARAVIEKWRKRAEEPQP